MRIRTLLVLAALAAVVAVPVAGQAAACNGKITTIGSGAAGSATIYVDDRADSPPQPGVLSGSGTWVYAEGNNVKGLQTGGDHPVIGDLDSDPCDNYAGASDILLI